MRQSFRLGRVAGVDIGVNWSVLVIVVLLAFGLASSILPAAAPGFAPLAYAGWALAAALLFFVLLLAHELAHVLVARHYGVHAKRITLWLLGGVSELDGEAPTPKAELLIAGAGPLTSLVAGGVGVLLAFGASAVGLPTLVVVALSWLAGVNIILGVFNLLPGAPLDGGRVLRAIVWRVTGDRTRAQLAADRAGSIIGFALIGAGVVASLFRGGFSGLWLVLLGWFLIAAARAESTAVRLRAVLDGRSVRSIMSSEPVVAQASQTVQMFLSTVAAQSRHRSFPVLDLDGQPVGVVRRADLVRLAPTARGTVGLGQLARGAGAVTIVAPDDPAEAAVKGLTPASPLVPVMENGRLVGIVTPADVAHATDLPSRAPSTSEPG
jgi:Zn-dependent protease/CBS domain-containing protein